MADDDSPIPKYRRPGFLAKQISLYYSARIAARMNQRYGNTDDPVEPIEGVPPVLGPHPVSDQIDPVDLNDL